jgi:glycosyltransferase involved in cell wall biosynthesis
LSDAQGIETCTIVVPCYNEERRLDQTAFLGLSEVDGINLLFVDDGSSDATKVILSAMADRSESIQALILTKNVGKGNAVRAGVLAAIEGGAAMVGFLDADLATPPQEMLRLVDVLRDRPELSVVMGSRVKRLGSHIERRAARHVIGRAFASCASLALGIPVYDSQCGAKVMRLSAATREAFRDPFRSSWSFDARLIMRLMTGSSNVPGLSVEAFCEIPLDEWKAVPGSKLRWSNGLRALVDITLVAVARRRHGRRSR